jgi:hypothetical protein
MYFSKQCGSICFLAPATLRFSFGCIFQFFKCQDRAKRYLSKPIKLFNEMQELFNINSANGFVDMNSFGCMNDRQILTTPITSMICPAMILGYVVYLA